MIARVVAEFVVGETGLRWILVHTHDVDDQARLLDVITELERREQEELSGAALCDWTADVVATRDGRESLSFDHQIIVTES